MFSYGASDWSAERTFMRVLVTGGAGFVGSHLVWKLLGEPAVTVRIPDNLHRCCKGFAGVPRVEFCKATFGTARLFMQPLTALM